MGQSLTTWIELTDEAATVAFGSALAAALPADTTGWLVLLAGELGAGKTTLARAVLAARGHAGTVPSPTYTLVEPYELASGSIYHVDLYRIVDESELEFLGWDALSDGLALVEWPERAPDAASRADLRVELDYSERARRVRVEGLSVRGEKVAERLFSALP